MNNEELLQKVLSTTIERFGKQTVGYEAEIANLSSQIFILRSQVEELSNEKTSKNKE